MIGPLANTTAALIALALVFLTLVGGALALDNPQIQALLRQQAWYQRLEMLHPSDLRFRGLVSLGLSLCSFAAILTLKLFVPEAGVWPALALGCLAVVSVTLGAAFLERAAALEGWR